MGIGARAYEVEFFLFYFERTNSRAARVTATFM